MTPAVTCLGPRVPGLLLQLPPIAHAADRKPLPSYLRLRWKTLLPRAKRPVSRLLKGLCRLVVVCCHRVSNANKEVVFKTRMTIEVGCSSMEKVAIIYVQSVMCPCSHVVHWVV